MRGIMCNSVNKSCLLASFWLILAFVPNIQCDDELSHSIQLTTIDFNSEIIANNYFVMFYAPWCSFCTIFKPTWEELAEMLNEPGSRVKIAKVDCTTESGICKQQEITGFPTLLYFKKGENDPVKYSGTRDLSSLANFLNDQLGTNLADQGDVLQPPGPVELGDENYEEHLSKGRHFVKFYAPWCGHCQSLAPTWHKLGMLYAPYETVTISKVDCTIHKEACLTYEVRSYPTLLWIENGVKIEKYSGGRSVDELQTYVDEKLSAESLDSALEGAGGGDKESAVPPPPPPPVVSLTGDTFGEVIKEGFTFVKFFAPWCGYCKSLAPIWEDLGKKYPPDGDITIADVDCMRQENKKLCDDQEVKGYPYMVLYKNGEKVDRYVGSRGLTELSAYVEEYLGGGGRGGKGEEGESHDEL